MKTVIEKKQAIRNRVWALLFVLVALPVAAQQQNPFLSRDFWKADPTVEDVRREIANGHNPAEMTSSAFDGVIYSMLEKADPEVTRFLLAQEGNDIEKKTHDSRTYIHWAAYAGNAELVSWLLEQGARTDVRDSHGYTPAAFAASTGQRNTEIYNLFASHGVNLANQKSESGANLLLLNVPYMDGMEEFAYFREKGIDLAETDDNGNGVFNYATRAGNIDLLKELVAAGVDYQTPNADGGNAFFFAAQGTRGHRNGLELYEYLAGLGLDPATVSKSGESAFHRVAYSDKDPEIIRFFLEHGAIANQPDAEGNTPYGNAAAGNTPEVVGILAGEVSDVDAANAAGQTALMRAVRSNNPAVVSLLIEAGADVAARDEKGNSISFYLLASFDASHPEVYDQKLAALQQAGFNLYETQAGGNTLYHLAADANSLPLLEKVAHESLDVNARNEEGMTALHIAAMKASDDALLRYLVGLGANTAIQTDFEETALDLARENERLDQNGVTLNFLN
ncbi:ankyrin repeat domain-containing protein [Robiginitalea biformata]|uniref:ankyrin repeat domain-containing protein n=1 Tax=Robiginitalea biformata TaxID=252307 RepID=UPI003B5C60CB